MGKESHDLESGILTVVGVIFQGENETGQVKVPTQISPNIDEDTDGTAKDLKN